MTIHNKLILYFPDNLTSRLTGFDYGRYIYREQAEDFIKKCLQSQIKPVIIFPSYIGGVSISFLKGFLSQLMKVYSKTEILKILEFQSLHFYCSKQIVKNIEESILF